MFVGLSRDEMAKGEAERLWHSMQSVREEAANKVAEVMAKHEEDRNR